MPNTNQKTCPHCGYIRNADDLFCGNCGQLIASDTSYPTRQVEELQQGLRTPILSDPEHSTNTPDPAQLTYPSPHFLPPQGNGLQGRTRVWQLASLISVPLVIILLLVITFQVVRGTNSQNPNMSNTQSPAAVQPGAGNASTPATQATATVNPLPTPTPSPSGLALTVRASIDGRSDLILYRNTVHWHHFDWAAPGRLDGTNFPTYLNGTAWFPTWPDVPTPENRDCNCYSSTFVGGPRLPARPQTVDLTIVKARGSASIVQQPDAGNDYTLVLEFNDNPETNADWYEVTLTYTD